MTVVSLHRANVDWTVHTTFQLKAHHAAASDKGFDFEILQGSTTPNGGVLNCIGGHLPPPLPAGGNPGSVKVPGATLATCVYEPQAGFTGKEALTYTAKDLSNNAVSAPTPINIEVRSQGLRWELLTGGSTGLTSDTGIPADIPAVLGGTTADVLFVLNWQTWRARERNQQVTLTDSVRRSQTTAPEAYRIAVRTEAIEPPRPTGSTTRKLNVLFRIGWVSDEAAVNATPVAPIASPPPSGNSSPSMPSNSTPVAATQRHLTASGQVDFAFVNLADSSGTFIEWGATGRAAIDVYPENSEQAKNTNGTLLQLANGGKTAFNLEGGFRFSLKQYAENPSSLALKDDQVVHIDNIQDLLLFEAGWQRNEAMAGLPVVGGESKNRYLIRLTTFLPVGLNKIPGRTKPALGLEVTRPIAGGEWATKVLYGVNLSGYSLFGTRQ